MLLLRKKNYNHMNYKFIHLYLPVQDIYIYKYVIVKIEQLYDFKYGTNIRFFKNIW